MADRALFQATSADIAPDGTTFVVLRWENVGEAVGYNIYRRPAAESPGRPLRPINGATPVRVPQSSRELKAIVAPGTTAWDTLAKLLAAAAGSGPRRGIGTVDPAEAFDRGLTEAERTLIQAGAQATLAMGRLAGIAYIDRGVKAHEQYRYELHGVRADDSTFVLAQDLLVEAGAFTLPAPPSGVTTQAGDRRVLVLWNRNPQAATFDVERAISAGGPFARVNPLPIAYDLATGLDGAPLALEQPGFLDIGAWDASGLPIPHQLLGTWISGPDTGMTYWYRVASRDALERQGSWSAPLAAPPVRTVAPMAPDELQVMPNTFATGLVVKWRTVTRNVENHAFTHQGVLDTSQRYHVYRAEGREQLEDLANLQSHLVAILSANPTDVARPVQEWHDTDPVLRPPYGAKPFFYRVRGQDAFLIPSAPSATIGAAVPDTIPPGPTTVVGAEGHAKHIRIEFKPNPEPDVAGYQIYRGVCDHGYVYVPGIVRKPEGEPEHRDDRYRCDMALVGDVPIGDANAILAVDGIIWFDDHSVPAGSPVCYAYWVRAYDFAGNLYGGDEHACPASRNEYRCASLREKTPPEIPVVTGLRARNNGVLVEWIASPEQDLRAFHIYRSDLEFDPPKFLACVFTDGSVVSFPWVGTVPSCAAVPAVSNPLTARGAYLDETAEPHRVYWYRVAALDWLGNESAGTNLLDIPASSTFTYTSDLPPTPAMLPQTPPAGAACGLDIAWGPPFDAAAIQGYVVFRGAPHQPYRQVSGILAATTFTDVTARRGVDYFYRVQAIDHAGTLSEPSPPLLHRY